MAQREMRHTVGFLFHFSVAEIPGQMALTLHGEVGGGERPVAPEAFCTLRTRQQGKRCYKYNNQSFLHVDINVQSDILLLELALAPGFHDFEVEFLHIAVESDSMARVGS